MNVKPQSSPEDWIRLEQYIDDSLSVGVRLYTVTDIFKAISTGEMQFWPGKNCVMVTSIINYPQCKMLDVVVGGGSLKELLSMEEILAVYAKQNGCQYLSTGGRRGWFKATQSHHHVITVFKEI